MAFVQIARAYLALVAGELDKHSSNKSVVKYNNLGSVSIFTPAHIQFAKYGRGPGKPPPIGPIEAWVSKKGIVGPNGSTKGAAIAIAKSIGKKGTKNYVPNAPDALTEAFQKHIKSYLASLSAYTLKRDAAKIKREAERALKLDSKK